MKNSIVTIFLMLFVACTAFARPKDYDYSKEVKLIEALLKPLAISEGKVYECTKEEVEMLLKAGCENEMNLFEILYATFLYLKKANLRVSMKGEILRELESKISYGNEKVYSLIPMSIMEELQVGPTQEEGKHEMDLFFSQNYEKYIEIGTAIYEKHVGFAKIEQNALKSSFGMTVKKLGLKKKIDKIVLYEKNKIAIYVKKFPIAKKWNIPAVSLK